MNLNQAQDCAFEHFTRNGFQVEELPFLARSLEWRPHALVSRTRAGVLSKAAIVVRENFASIKEPHLWEPLIETRRQMPVLAIYFAVPESENRQPLQDELQELGIGLFLIRPNGKLQKVINDRVPFDDETMTYPIEPGKPYRNRQSLFKVLAHSIGHIWWIDKHFTMAGLDYLSEFFTAHPNFAEVNEIKILGTDIVGNPELNLLRVGLNDLNTELRVRGITVEMKLIDIPTRRAIHDRYIISRNTTFNVLPTRAMRDGQYGSLVLDDNPPDFMTLWAAAAPL
ncbi:MAG: hypothetical protein KF762_13475 [Acidobacteria bacterium]|nr:hypothetical protein [Acidobacteriota bacterium]